MKKHFAGVLTALLCIGMVGCASVQTKADTTTPPPKPFNLGVIGETNNATYSVIVDPNTNIEYIVVTTRIYTINNAYQVVTAITPRVDANQQIMVYRGGE